MWTVMHYFTRDLRYLYFPHSYFSFFFSPMPACISISHQLLKNTRECKQHDKANDIIRY